MAWILTIFGPNESSCHDRFEETFANEQNERKKSRIFVRNSKCFQIQGGIITTSITDRWSRLHLQFPTSLDVRPDVQIFKRPKIARMARNSTVFRPNESSRRDLFLENFSKEWNKRKVLEKLRKIFKNLFEKNFERCNVPNDSGAKKAHKPNFLGKFCRQQIWGKFSVYKISPKSLV